MPVCIGTMVPFHTRSELRTHRLTIFTVPSPQATECLLSSYSRMSGLRFCLVLSRHRDTGGRHKS